MGPGGAAKDPARETLLVQPLSSRKGRSPPLGRQANQDRTPVLRMGDPLHQRRNFQPIDRIRHARWVHLKPAPNDPHGKRSPPAEHEQHQYLVTSKGQPQGPQDLVGTRQQKLLRPHDRRHRRHTVRCGGPSVGDPMIPRLFHRIEWQSRRHTSSLASTSASPEPTSPLSAAVKVPAGMNRRTRIATAHDATIARPRSSTARTTSPRNCSW